MATQKKIKITVQMGDGPPGVVEYDEFVLIGWDIKESGTLQTFTQTSSPPERAGEHLLTAGQAIARAMKKSTNSAVQSIGAIMESTVANGLAYLEAALTGEEH